MQKRIKEKEPYNDAALIFVQNCCNNIQKHRGCVGRFDNVYEKIKNVVFYIDFCFFLHIMLIMGKLL